MDIFRNPNAAINTLVRMLRAGGIPEIAELLEQSDYSFENTGFDNYNGGTNVYTFFVKVDAEEFVQISSRIESIERAIDERLGSIVQQFSDDWISTKIVPKIEGGVSSVSYSGKIDRRIRNNIFDGLKIEKVVWAGELNEVEFLERIFDLTSLPSTDNRYSDAARDIWQHRVNNPDDWDDDWIFRDKRFNLIEAEENIFLRFLCEIIHPVVRPDRDECIRLCKQFNDQLKNAGWKLVEEESIAGRPRFSAARVGNSKRSASSRARSVADSLNASWMAKEIQRAEYAIENDPALAIGTAKDLVESCCKTLLERCNQPVEKSDDLPKLSRKLIAELRLVPSGIPDEARGASIIRRLLSNFVTITQGVSELRGLYGSGHGRGGSYRGLEPRHARLAVSSAVTFIEFVTETYRDRHSLSTNSADNTKK